MKKCLSFFVLFFLSFYASVADAENLKRGDEISGKTFLGIDVVESYDVNPDQSVLTYQWIPPVGCKILEGQGTETIMLQSTYLSQNSQLQVIRLFEDQDADTLKLSIDFHRTISMIRDYTIAPGENIVIAGTERNVADIYYEEITGENGLPQIVAHRLTVEPKAGVYVEMTKPYLQTMSANSVWITWKTSYECNSVVHYGQNETSLSQEAEGSYEQLSDNYYWHSVQLSGLTPDTFYSYKVKSGDKESEVYRFKTAPETGSKIPLRILLMGDHQIKSRSGYEWLMQAAKRKVEEKYGNVEENISMIMNVGDQVDVGTFDHYEHIHLLKSELLSPNLPIMTTVGNHETYYDPEMANYAAMFHYEDIKYKGISSETENYYAYQFGRILFIVLSTEHTGNVQKTWVQKVINAAKDDENVDFIVSVNHRPIQAEQYIGDISYWVRDEVIPILSQTDKHVLNYGGHHHLYHRGQWADYPFYHIINGGASWDQMWGMSSEKDYDDVQKTIDYWGYQILEFDFEKKEMIAECYAIGNKELVTDNILIDTFHRRMGQEAPEKPVLTNISDIITLPYIFKAGEYQTNTDQKLNTTQFQVSTTQDFSSLAMNVIRDFENLYGSTGQPWHIPVDIHEFMDITSLTVNNNVLKNGIHYIRVRYRDENLEWSPWSETKSFKIEGSIDGDPAISVNKNIFAIGQEISINYEFVPEGQNAWIGIYRQGDNPGSETRSVKWSYTDAASGIYTFSLDATDEYYAVLFEDEGYTEVTARIPFYIGEIPVLDLEKTAFEVDEPIPVSYSNAPGLNGDWIGVYRMGKTPGNEYSDSWAYTEDGSQEGNIILSSGSGNAGKLSKGYYFINYFARGGYFEVGERQYISVGSDISTISVDTPDFSPNEDIIIYYNSGPGTPKDWIGVYKEGKVVGVDELDGFYYTYGETDGYVTIPAGELKSSDYFVSLYINDSYDEVSPRIHITIGKSPEISVIKSDMESVIIGFQDNEKWRNDISSILVNDEEVAKDDYMVEPGKIEISGNAFRSKKLNMYMVTVVSKDWKNVSTQFDLETNVEWIETEVNRLKVYPNPVKDYVYLEGLNGGQVTLFGLSGNKIAELNINENRAYVGDLEPGTYIIQVETKDTVMTAKMLKD